MRYNPRRMPEIATKKFPEFDKPAKALFLEVLQKTGNISQSARTVGFHLGTVYRHRTNDEVFREAWEWAERQAADRLEEEARRRAVDGVKKPIMYQGKQVGTVKEYSDTLLVKMLEAKKPNEYKDQRAMGGAGVVVVNKINLGAPEPKVIDSGGNTRQDKLTEQVVDAVEAGLDDTLGTGEDDRVPVKRQDDS